MGAWQAVVECADPLALDEWPGHGERSRLQLLLKLAGTDTEGFPFWLFNLVLPVYLRVFLVFCRVIKGVLVPETRSPCFSRSRAPLPLRVTDDGASRAWRVSLLSWCF